MYPILETERLYLKPLQENDFEDMFRLLSNPVVGSTREGGAENDPAKFQTEHRQAVENGEHSTLRLKETDAFVGYLQLHSYVKQGRVAYSQINAALLPEYWGHGYCTEAAEKLLRFAFFGIKTPWLCANQFQDNPAAGSVLKKCGFRFYRTFRMQNRLYDQYRYRLDDYRADHPFAPDADQYDAYAIPVRTSPYSAANPIRTIDRIDYMEQPTQYLCGQSVVAMLAGVPVEEVVEVMQTDRGADVGAIRDALEYYGLKTATKSRIRYTGGTELPRCCILSVKLPGYGHWSLYYEGKYYDPEFGVAEELPGQAKLCYYWEVLVL